MSWAGDDQHYSAESNDVTVEAMPVEPEPEPEQEPTPEPETREEIPGFPAYLIAATLLTVALVIRNENKHLRHSM